MAFGGVSAEAGAAATSDGGESWESMLKSLDLNDNVSAAQFDGLANMLREKLGVDMDQSGYREMAKAFVKCKVSSASSSSKSAAAGPSATDGGLAADAAAATSAVENMANLGRADPPMTAKSESGSESTFDEQPTWSLSTDSSSPESVEKTVPPRAGLSASPMRMRRPSNNKPIDASPRFVRGRSPARERQMGKRASQRSTRSQTPPLSPFTSLRGSQHKRASATDQSPRRSRSRSRSASPFRVFGRVSSKQQMANDDRMPAPKQDPPSQYAGQASSPSVYLDSTMDLGSPAPLPTPNTSSRPRPSIDTTSGISPLVNLHKSAPSPAAFSKPPTPASKRKDRTDHQPSMDDIDEQATRGSFHAPAADGSSPQEHQHSSPISPDFTFGMMKDIKFSPGSSPSKRTSPGKRSSPRGRKSPRSRPPRPLEPQPTPGPAAHATPMTEARANPNDPAFIFSPSPTNHSGNNLTMDFSISKTPGMAHVNNNNSNNNDDHTSPLCNNFQNMGMDADGNATPQQQQHQQQQAFNGNTNTMPSPIPVFQAPEQIFAGADTPRFGGMSNAMGHNAPSLPTPKAINVDLSMDMAAAHVQPNFGMDNTTPKNATTSVSMDTPAGDKQQLPKFDTGIKFATGVKFDVDRATPSTLKSRKNRPKGSALKFRHIRVSQSATKPAAAPATNAQAAAAAAPSASAKPPTDAQASVFGRGVHIDTSAPTPPSPGGINLSPMSVDGNGMGTPGPSFGGETPGAAKFATETPTMDQGCLFSIGVGDKTKPQSARHRPMSATRGVTINPNGRTARPRSARRGGSSTGVTFANKTAPAVSRTSIPTKPFAQSEPQAASQVPARSSLRQASRYTTTQNEEQEAEEKGVDYSGLQSYVQAQRDEARELYMTGDYRASIIRNTNTINICKPSLPKSERHILAVILSNRAAGLLMVGAFRAAADDCKEALACIASIPRNAASADTSPVSAAKVWHRLAKSLLKLGETEPATEAFSSAMKAAEKSLAESLDMGDSSAVNVARKAFEQLSTEVHLGRSEAKRLRETMQRIGDSNNRRSTGTPATERRKTLQILSDVSIALTTAPQCPWLQERKISLLAELRRWREIASFCERLATSNAESDGVFTQDLESKNPFPGVPQLRSLAPNFFGDAKEDELPGAELKLNSKAVAEAVLRMPRQLILTYARALRLEERYPAAEALIATLQSYVRERSKIAGNGGIRSGFAWLNREHDKLIRTRMARERGDELFRAGRFDDAAAMYAQCLTIDVEGSDARNGSTSGGRLHAVLYCNRAACLMAQGRYHEAITECTAALRIHSRYMKAMVRRARCYTKLDRLEESIAEFKKWIELANEGQQPSSSMTAVLTPCLFDGPHEVSESEMKKVKTELENVMKMKTKREAEMRAQESSRRQYDFHQRQQRSNSANHGEAHRRREQFFNQKNGGTRRWDSFADRGPKGSNSGSSSRRPRSEHKKSSPKPPPKSSVSTTPKNGDDHYAVLKVPSSASESEIKKAYRRLALKYHPDKNSDPKAVDIFRRVSQAYETLSDRSARRQYDRERPFRRQF